MIKIALIIFSLTYWISYKISTGIILSVIFLILLQSIMLSANISKKQLNINICLSDYLFFLYSISGLYGTLFYSELNSLYFKMTLYPWFITFAFQNGNFRLKEAKIIFLCVFLSALLISLIMFFQESPGNFNFSVDYILSKNRAYGFYFLNPEDTAGPTTIASLFSLCIILMFIYTKETHRISIFNIAALIILVFFLLLSGGRAAILACAISLAILFSIYLKNRKVFLRLMIIFFGIVTFLFVIFFVLEFFEKIHLIPLPTIRRFYNPVDESLLTRLWLWKVSLKFIESNPFGYGYSYILDRFGRTPHNEIISQIVGGGVFSAFFWSLIFIYFTKISFNMLHDDRSSKLLPAVNISLICFVFLIGFTENFSLSSNNTFYPLIWIIFGTSNSIRNIFKKSNLRIKLSQLGHF